MVDLSMNQDQVFKVGDLIPVEISISGSNHVNAAEVDVIFDNDKLTFVSVDYSTSAFSISARSELGSPLIRMSRAIANGWVTGTNVFAVLNFRAMKPGLARLDFTPECLVSDFDSEENVLLNRVGSVFTITDIDTLSPAPYQ